MRHGHAAASSPTGDEGRALTASGGSEIDEVGRGLSRAGVCVDTIWHSPYLRATQTAERVGAALSTSLGKSVSSAVPHGAPHELAAQLLGARATRLLLVSHLPLLPALASVLLGADVSLNFTPGTVARLLFVGRGEVGTAVLGGLWEPGLLTCAGGAADG